MMHLVSAFVALTLSSFAAHAQDKTQEFVRKAAVANSFQIASSELAVERAQSPEVREFAQHMIEDHRQAAKELQDAVEKTELGVGVRETLDKKHADMMQVLGESSRAEFDRKYVEMQKTAHAETAELFESYLAREGMSEPLSTFARDTLPVIEEHNRRIEQLSQRKAADL